jgi:hypothetical protein
LNKFNNLSYPFFTNIFSSFAEKGNGDDGVQTCTQQTSSLRAYHKEKKVHSKIVCWSYLCNLTNKLGFMLICILAKFWRWIYASKEAVIVISMLRDTSSISALEMGIASITVGHQYSSLKSDCLVNNSTQSASTLLFPKLQEHL